MPDNRKKSSRRPLPFAQRSQRRMAEQNDDMLAEFSHGDDDFYVDEVSENSRQERQKKAPPARRTRERKPVSPLTRRIRRIVSYCLIVAVIMIVGVVLSLTVLFKTQAYEVIGTERYPKQDIINVCGISEGENIFLAPKRPAENRIKENFPYIEEVDVTFKIPDTIRINLTEAVEGYLVMVSDTEYILISTKGRILDKVDDISKYDLPIFIGPSISAGEIGDYVNYEDRTIMDIIDEVSQVFADNGYQGISEIDATNPANISFTYDGRIKVKLGLPEELSYKIRTAMTIINENIDVNAAASIEGVLDVSRCNVTKKSYFDEKPLLDINDSTDSDEDTAQDGESGISNPLNNSDDADGGAQEQESLSVDDWYL